MGDAYDWSIALYPSGSAPQVGCDLISLSLSHVLRPAAESPTTITVTVTFIKSPSASAGRSQTISYGIIMPCYDSISPHPLLPSN